MQTILVVAVVLSMSEGKPMGYEYPTPKVPFIEGTTMSTAPPPDCVPPDTAESPYYQSLLDLGTPLCPTEQDYDDYDPDDIPEDQAAPGYAYPALDNPLTLPTKQPTPACILYDEKSEGSNSEFLEAGVPLCPDYDYEYDDYDSNDIPEDQAMPLPDCIEEDEKESGMNQKYLSEGVPLCEQEDPAGYEYPVPPNPLTLPPRSSTSPAPEIYDDYDPEDIPEDQAESKGYEYPVPEIPFTLPPRVTTPLPSYQPSTPEYDDYDINDVPEDQAAPDCVEDPVGAGAGVPLCPQEGYSYPVPSNPLQLPERSRTAKLVLEDDSERLLIGLAHSDDDTYDPEYYDHNSQDYIDSIDDDFSESEKERRNSVTESGVSLTGVGKVFSFHIPSSFTDLPNNPKSQSVRGQNEILEGSRLPATFKAGSRKDKSKGRTSILSRVPKMLDHDRNKLHNLQATKNKRLGKSLGSKSKKSSKISVQDWLRRG